MPVIAVLVVMALAALAYRTYARKLEGETLELEMDSYAAAPLSAARQAELVRAGRTWYEWVGTRDVTQSLSVAVSRRYQAVIIKAKTARAPGGPGHVPARHRHGVA